MALEEQEDRLLDVLAEGSLDTSKVKGRLRKIQRDRNRLNEEKADADTQLTTGAQAFRLPCPS